jgi:hypothetical protein
LHTPFVLFNCPYAALGANQTHQDPILNGKFPAIEVLI